MRAETRSPTGMSGRVLGAAAVAVALALACPGPIVTPCAAAPAVRPTGFYCDSCPEPVINTFGIEFRHNDLWTLAADGTMTRLLGCQPVQVISVQGFHGMASSLGWDSMRDLFVVIDDLLDSVMVVDLNGNVVRNYPSPGSGPIGVAYDPTRDAYWITDFETDSLYAIDAATGGRVAGFHLPAGVRAAGAVYDPSLDAIIYEDRVLAARGHIASCTTGALLDSFVLPYTGLNGWQDNTLGPSGTLWIHNFELEAIYCVDRASTPTRATTWGGLKLLFSDRPGIRR